MGVQISRLCKYFRGNDSKVYQQQNSGSISQHRSKIFVLDNSDGYDIEPKQHFHHAESIVKIEWKKGELIGQGSFGRVYKCMDIKTGRILAVKQIELGYVDKESLESFHQEIKILSRLKHKNIVKYYGCDEDKNHLSILLEYVGGIVKLKIYHQIFRILRLEINQYIPCINFQMICQLSLLKIIVFFCIF